MFENLNLPYLPEDQWGDQHFGLALALPGQMYRIIARTATMAEMADTMEKVAPHLPTGTLIWAARYTPTAPAGNRWNRERFLLTQIGRQHRLV